MKNLVYVGIIVVVLGVGGYLIFAGDSTEGIDSLSNEEQVWVMCLDCGTSYQMGKKDFHLAVQEKAKERPNTLATVYLTCEKCGKDAVLEAVKCEKCGNVFVKRSIPNDLPDRCPKCKFSKTEEIRQERLNK